MNKVKISKIIEIIEMTMEESFSVYSKKDNEFIWIDEFGDLSIDDIEFDDNYIDVINEYDKREFYIESGFIRTLSGDLYTIFDNAFYGRGKYRKFKDCLAKYHLWDAFNDFEESIYKEYAIDWCNDHKIEYIDDVK